MRLQQYRVSYGARIVLYLALDLLGSLFFGSGIGVGGGGRFPAPQLGCPFTQSLRSLLPGLGVTHVGPKILVGYLFEKTSAEQAHGADNALGNLGLVTSFGGNVGWLTNFDKLSVFNVAVVVIGLAATSTKDTVWL